MKSIGMTICATGCANNGMRQIKEVTKYIEELNEDGALENHHLGSGFENADLGMAHIAVSCLHDALMALVRGDMTIEQTKDFFFGGNIPDKSDYFGDIIKLSEDKPTQNEGVQG